MTGQMDLFGFEEEEKPKRKRIRADAAARRLDPETSHGAAASVLPKCAQLEATVLNALRRAVNGLTIDELVAALQLDKVTLSPRLRPLCRKGFVVETQERRPGHSGRPQIVWKAVKARRGEARSGTAL